MHGPGGIRGAIKILSARIAQIDRFRINDGAIASFGLVVDDGGIRSSGRYSVERKADKMLVLTAVAIVSFSDLPRARTDLLQSNLFKLISCLHLIEFVSFCRKFFLEPGKIFTQRGSVSDVTGPHTFELGLVLDCFGVANGTSNLFNFILSSKF